MADVDVLDMTLDEYTAKMLGNTPSGGALAELWSSIKTATLNGGTAVVGIVKEGYETVQGAVKTVYGDVIAEPLQTTQLILILLAVAIILLVIYNPGFLKGLLSVGL